MDAGQILLESARNLNRGISAISASGLTLLNAWQRDWATRWPYMPTLEVSAVVTTSANTNQYSLASNIDKIQVMYIPASSQTLARMTFDQLKSVSPSAASDKGVPTVWAPYQEDQVQFYPMPDGSYDINYLYYSDPTEIGATSATPTGIDSKYHDAGVWYVTYRIAAQMGDNDTRDMAYTEYNRVFEAAKLDMIARVAGRKTIRMAGDYQNLNPSLTTEDTVKHLLYP